jgi:hypothetical protein
MNQERKNVSILKNLLSVDDGASDDKHEEEDAEQHDDVDGHHGSVAVAEPTVRHLRVDALVTIDPIGRHPDRRGHVQSSGRGRVPVIFVVVRRHNASRPVTRVSLKKNYIQFKLNERLKENKMN